MNVHLVTDRQLRRAQVLKVGMLAFDGTMLACIVANLSPKGALVRTQSAVALPELIELHIGAGMSVPSRRRWANGREIGLEFVGKAKLNDPAVELACSIEDALRIKVLHTVVDQLRALGFFGDPELHEKAVAAEIALEAFIDALRGRARHH